MKEEEVIQFLSDSPDFFVKHTELLEALTLPHPASGKAISLLEYQVNQLRKSTASYRNEFERLVEVARENESTMKKSRRLVLASLACETLDDFAVVVDDMIRDDFDIPFHSLVLFDDYPDCSIRTHFLTEDDLVLPQTSGFAECYCGELPEGELDFLFAENAKKIQSIAVLPILSTRPDSAQNLGVLVLGADQVSAFHHDKGAMFLQYIADLLSAILTRLIK